MILRGLSLPLILLFPATTWAHGGNPAVAWVNDPENVGTVVDESFPFTWLDSNTPIPTGTATVDFYYTARRPYTFPAGAMPETLEGTAIVQGILETDRADRYVWDTSGVPAGSYLIWSRVTEPVEVVMSPQIISFSPGVLTVAHPGDPVHPAVLLATPDTPFRFADESFDIQYSAFDPDGTGTVTLEVTQSYDGTDFEVLADDLPAVENGNFIWDTSQRAEGDWTLRVTITDARGLSFTNYSRYFLLVTHFGPRPDGGFRDSGITPDGGVIAPDAGTSTVEETCEGGCCCRAERAPHSGGLFGALLCLAALGFRRARFRAR